MALTGSIEILSENATVSEGWRIEPEHVADIPGALTALRGLTGFTPLPIPEGPPLPDDPTWSRRYHADAVWEAQDRDGKPVEVIWREHRELTIQEIAAALEAAEEG